MMSYLNGLQLLLSTRVSSLLETGDFELLIGFITIQSLIEVSVTDEIELVQLYQGL